MLTAAPLESPRKRTRYRQGVNLKPLNTIFRIMILSGTFQLDCISQINRLPTAFWSTKACGMDIGINTQAVLAARKRLPPVGLSIIQVVVGAPPLPSNSPGLITRKPKVGNAAAGLLR